MSYDPRDYGARCDECVLQHCTPVPPEDNPTAKFAIVGSSPREDEEREGRPFVGAGGRLLTSVMRSAGLFRRDAFLTHTLACRPPGNDLKRLNDKIRKANKKLAKENPGEPPIPTPEECCAPRLEAELRNYTNIVALGTTALRAITKSANSVMSLRGLPIDMVRSNGQSIRLMPMLHPDFVLRAQRWKHIFINDISRAKRYFKGQLEWPPPKIHYSPPPDFVEAFLNRDEPWFTCDLETDGIECLTANIRCVGIGVRDEVIIVGLLGIDGAPRDYFGRDRERVIDIMKRFFLDKTKIKVGHNFGYYDKIVIQSQWGITPEPILDTMLLHRLVESELPHSLGFLGSTRTDAPSWKTDREGRKKSTESETDRELDEYCGYDVAVTDECVDKLIEDVKFRQQWNLVSVDHRLQSICADMHTVGMYVDQEARQAEHAKLIERLTYHRAEVQKATGRPDLNPGSIYQLRDVFFEEWGLDPDLEDKIKYTPAGDPSTSDDVLRACMILRDITPQQYLALEHTRYYRKAQKLLGTYVAKIAYNTELIPNQWEDEDEDWAEYAWRVKHGEVRQGIVDPKTGRMYPGYNAHVTTSGRLSSSKPINAQNFPFFLRNLVTAAPGHILVGADADQLELRAAASRWKSRLYLDVLAAGHDPHSTATCMAVFGDRFVKAAGCPPPWPTGFKFNKAAKSLRDLGKRVQYASQYKAAVETVWRVIRQTEVPDPNAPPDQPWRTILPYAKLSLKDVRLMVDNWLKGAKFDIGWDQEIQTWRQQGYLTEPIMGRRRDFLDGENPNELVNFPIQAGGASWMNKALFEVADQIPLNKWGPGTGIINQCHDSIVVECPIDGAYQEEYKTPEGKIKKQWVAPKGSIPWRVANIIEEAMNGTHPGFPGVEFTATADIGMTWAEV